MIFLLDGWPNLLNPIIVCCVDKLVLYCITVVRKGDMEMTMVRVGRGCNMMKPSSYSINIIN